jgi:hypothetical protein
VGMGCGAECAPSKERQGHTKVPLISASDPEGRDRDAHAPGVRRRGTPGVALPTHVAQGRSQYPSGGH